jgi:hypothetical protein
MTTRVLEHFFQKLDFDSLSKQLLRDFEAFRQASEKITSAGVPGAAKRNAPRPPDTRPKAETPGPGPRAEARADVPGPRTKVEPPRLPETRGTVGAPRPPESANEPGPRLPPKTPSETYEQCLAGLKVDTEFLNFLTAPLECKSHEGGRRRKTRKLSSRGPSTRRVQRRL